MAKMIPDTKTLTRKIKTEALHLGFQLVGVTSPEPPLHWPVVQAWLDSGRHGEMHYLANERSRQRRANPRQILPDCQSILVLGTRYPAAPRVSEAEPSLGQVASYAWGADYHDVLGERLAALVEFIQQQAGAPVSNRWYSDTGPILERELAQRAGLGWIGKNTCLINPQQGSYFFLSEILLGIPLELDDPFEADRCGSCTRCIDACPTACILPDRTLDARRCISYLTIELKGALPVELRPQVGTWVFGCDVCQQVCPWNLRFANPQSDPVFAPRPGVAKPVLVDELALNADEFNHKFKDSPVKRTKRRGYLRNVAVALSGRNDPTALDALTAALRGDPEVLVRRHAAWALGASGSPAAKDVLQEALLQEIDEDVQAEIYSALDALESTLSDR